MLEYPKIPGPFKRHTEGPDKNRLIIGDWTSPELELLADTDWIWTEKVDGTNVRVFWDGYNVTFGGRTANAQMPMPLLTVLQDMFREELFELKFGDTQVTLYGEGFGAGIQKGGAYRSSPSFVLFDVLIDGWWLLRDDIEDIGDSLGAPTVPVRHVGDIWGAMDAVEGGLPSAWNPELVAEGLVGTTSVGLLRRNGKRIIVKIKTADFAK